MPRQEAAGQKAIWCESNTIDVWPSSGVTLQIVTVLNALDLSRAFSFGRGLAFTFIELLRIPVLVRTMFGNVFSRKDEGIHRSGCGSN
jgi:hypothetical protein